LDAKYSRWLSADPAVGEYIPQAPVNDEARKHNQSLPGMGGVFNIVNLQLYHYAGNNPVKYTDPDGRSEDLGGGLDDHCTVRRTEEGKHVIIDGGKKYNYVEANLVNYLNTGDERYFNKLPVTSNPLGVSGIFAFIEDYLGGSGDTNTEIDFTGTKSNIVFSLAIAIACSTGGNRDKEAIGSTGRTIANNLKEKLAMEQVQSSPELGKQLNVKMADAKNGWFASDGWVKMSQNVNGIEIHYIHNTQTGIYTDYKFK